MSKGEYAVYMITMQYTIWI